MKKYFSLVIMSCLFYSSLNASNNQMIDLTNDNNEREYVTRGYPNLYDRENYTFIYEMPLTQQSFQGIDFVEIELPNGEKGRTKTWRQGYKLPFYKLPEMNERLGIKLAKNDPKFSVFITFYNTLEEKQKTGFLTWGKVKLERPIDPSSPNIVPDLHEIGIHSSGSTSNPLNLGYSTPDDLRNLRLLP